MKRTFAVLRYPPPCGVSIVVETLPIIFQRNERNSQRPCISHVVLLSSSNHNCGHQPFFFSRCPFGSMTCNWCGSRNNWNDKEAPPKSRLSHSGACQVYHNPCKPCAHCSIPARYLHRNSQSISRTLLEYS